MESPEEEDPKVDADAQLPSLQNLADSCAIAPMFETQICPQFEEDLNSYSQDEQALAVQKAQFNLVDEKSEQKSASAGSDGRSNPKNRREKGSPSMITRIFCNKILSNSEFTLTPGTEKDIKKEKPLTQSAGVSNEDECLSSSSIYDHIETFTFDDYSPATKPASKSNLSKPKTAKSTANVNSNRLRKPNFPGYSESFKQILDKRNLLAIHKTKIQKRLSRRGEQLQKMVRRSESKFLKDANKMDPNKMDPNLTYDRRNIKSDVVNHEMVGGDVYVSVVKQPVIERGACQQQSDSYENLDEVKSELSDAIKMKEDAGTDLRCEILTVV